MVEASFYYQLSTDEITAATDPFVGKLIKQYLFCFVCKRNGVLCNTNMQIYATSSFVIIRQFNILFGLAR